MEYKDTYIEVHTTINDGSPYNLLTYRFFPFQEACSDICVDVEFNNEYILRISNCYVMYTEQPNYNTVIIHDLDINYSYIFDSTSVYNISLPDYVYRNVHNVTTFFDASNETVVLFNGRTVYVYNLDCSLVDEYAYTYLLAESEFESESESESEFE